MKGSQLLLLFMGLIVVTVSLSDISIAPLAFVLVVQSLRAGAVQSDALMQAEIEPHPSNPHGFFASQSTSQLTSFTPKSTALSERCIHLWDLLEPVSDEQYKQQFTVTGTQGTVNARKILKKFTKTLSLARAEGGSTKQMMDLIFGKPYLPKLKVDFVETYEEYGDPLSVANYNLVEHALMFSPSVSLNSTSALGIHRVFIHEAVHAAETLKNFKGLSRDFMMKKASLDQNEGRRFSTMYQVQKTGTDTRVEMKNSKAANPYFGEEERRVFYQEYESCNTILKTVHDAIIEGVDVGGIHVTNTAGVQMSAQVILAYYEIDHVSIPFFPMGPFNAIKQAQQIKEYSEILGKDNEMMTFPIRGTKYMVNGLCRQKIETKLGTFFLISFPDIEHNFVATFSQFSRSLHSYPDEAIDAEKITHIKEHYKTQFIANICPGLEAFFMATNQRFKEDLIEACETEDDPITPSSTF